MKALLIFCLVIFPSAAIANKTAEELRAAYLMQIPAFVRYTNASHKPVKLNYCFAEQLGKVGSLIKAKETILKERINFELFVIKEPTQDSLKDCTYLYLAKNTENIEDYIEHHDVKTITLGEEESILPNGALMALIQEQNKIRIYINRTKLSENTVSFNARLLSLSKVNNY